jgi:hypothetical protein
MKQEEFEKQLSELLDTLPRPEFGIDCIIVNTSESVYNKFNRLRQELWGKFINDKDENFKKEKQDLLDKINLYEDCKEFEKQKFKEQEEIRDNYYKLLNNV